MDRDYNMKVTMKKEFIDDISIILTQKHLITPQDLVALHRSFKDRNDVSFEDFVLEEGIVEKSDLLAALSDYYQVPAIDVKGQFFDHYDITLIPKNVMLQHYFIPYDRDENDTLWVIAANPNDPHLRVVIGEHVTHNIHFMVGLPTDIIDAVQENYDESITPQPQEIQNQKMERSQPDIHPTGEVLKPEYSELEIPVTWQDNIDDYEKD